MSPPGPQISHKVRLAAEQVGDVGAAWLASLEETIARVELDWRATVGAGVGRGSEAYVARAQTREGRPAALKIVAPWVDPQRRELAVLKAAQGQGYAELIQADETRNILLLEGLGTQLADAPMTEDERTAVICANLRIAWSVPSPTATAMPTGADKAAEFAKLIEALWAANGQPCSRRAIDAAMVSASRRGAAFHPAKAVLAHGDAHAWNTLAKLDGTGRYAFIDPDGAFAEPAFDLAVLMREWGDRMPEGDLAKLAQRRCAHLNRLTGVATADIWDWSLLQCLSSGLDLVRIGARQAAAPQLAMADAWAERIEAFA